MPNCEFPIAEEVILNEERTTDEEKMKIIEGKIGTSSTSDDLLSTR